MLRTLQCPSCGGPLQPPGRFARETTCPFCGVRVVLDPARVHAERFHAALRAWEAEVPAVHLSGARWVLGPLVGRGGVADVYRVHRPRFPSERGLLKVLRAEGDRAVLTREWATLAALAEGTAPGAPVYTMRIPEPVATGVIGAGPFAGCSATIFRATPGFRVPLAQVPRGPHLAQASIWVWRRVLEVLTFLHRAGFAHGNLHARHILVEDGEHGARLVGFGNAARAGEPRLVHDRTPEGVVPEAPTLSAAHDVAASARTVVALLGGDVTTGRVPDLPATYAELLRGAALGAHTDAWALREALGPAAAGFGRPAFLPLASPKPEDSHG